MQKKKRRIIVMIIILLLLFISIISEFYKGKESSYSKVMYRETFCLYGSIEKHFYRNPSEVLRVYGYNEVGEEIDYKVNVDYIIDYDKGTIVRTKNSSIPDYSKHRVIYQENRKFSFKSEPRNPELNVMFQIKVDYSYNMNVRVNGGIKNASSYLSKTVKDKIKKKEDIKIIVTGDSIAGGAQTTSQFFYDDGIKDSFSGYLKDSLESYYGCTVEMDLFSNGG